AVARRIESALPLLPHQCFKALRGRIAAQVQLPTFARVVREARLQGTLALSIQDSQAQGVVSAEQFRVGAPGPGGVELAAKPDPLLHHVSPAVTLARPG